MTDRTMNLKVLLPFEVFLQSTAVVRIVAQTHSGSFGLLPRRLDCTAVLAPGLLTYETPKGEEVVLAVDQGVLIKAGPEVLVSVRRAVRGKDLGQLRQLVHQEFLTLDETEQSMRVAMAKLESGFMRRFASFRNE